LSDSAKTVIPTKMVIARLIGRINNAAIVPIKNKPHPKRNKYSTSIAFYNRRHFYSEK
jgi:hypothetical protein